MHRLTRRKTVPPTALLLAISLFLPSPLAKAFQNETTETPVDYVDDRPGPQAALGTKKYEPSKEEKPFFNKLDQNEVATGGLAGDYNIRTRDKKYVGWFGIVREIERDKTSNTTRLLVEHKYFDGLTDLHLQAVSFNGSGDFEATLRGTDHFIKELELIKIYGVVRSRGAQRPALIETEFARCWSWGTFAFLMASGKQRGSEKWRKLNTIPLDDIYTSRPDESYYTKRLGPTKAMKKRLKIDALGRKAAVTMGVDPQSLRDKSGSYARLITDQAFRKQATESALKLQPTSKPHIEPIVSAIIAADYGTMHEAIDSALEADMHDAVAVVLVHAFVLNDDDDTAATNRLRDLSFSASNCVPALVEALRCDDDWSRSYAADVLGSVGEQAEQAIPALLILLGDANQFARANAATALGQIATRPELVVPALGLALEDSDSHVRFSAAGSLGSFGRDAKQAARMLAKVVQHDEEDNARWNAAWALGKTGDAEVALPVLIKGLSSLYSPIRRFAAMGLGELGPSGRDAVPHLRRLLEDIDSGTRIAAAEALWRIEHNAEDSLPILARSLKGGFPAAMWAGNAVTVIGPAAQPVVSELLLAAKSDNRYVRSAAVRAIANIGPEAREAVPRLRKLLKDEDVETRAFAAAAIWNIEQDTDAVAFLTRMAGSDTEGMNYVIRAVGAIGTPAKNAIPAIEGHLSDQDQFVRAAAKTTLRILNAEE